MSLEKFSVWYAQLQKKYYQKGWRNLVVLAGEPIWQNAMLSAADVTFDTSSTSDQSLSVIKGVKALIYTNTESVKQLNYLTQQKHFTLVNRKNSAKQLGTEQNVVIFDVGANTSDFDVNAFAALSGTIVAGGTLFLLLPTIAITASSGQSNEQCEDHFFQRFSHLLKSQHTSSVYLFQQGEDTPCDDVKCEQTNDVLPAYQQEFVDINCTDFSTNSSIESCPKLLPYGCITHEQVKAVDSIFNVVKGHRNRPLVLTADRGRGKSSALAIAVYQMLTNGSAAQKHHIILTAPSRRSVEVIFQYLEKHLSNIEVSANSVSHANGELVFLPIDQVVKQNSTPSLVLVDEAAGFPIYLLAQLLNRYHRIVFSSTVHGYEGAGRGFNIKFRALLNKQMPQWRKLHINEAIRWASDDPLEAFVFKSCLLNAELNALLPMFANELDNVSEPKKLHQRYENLQVRLLTPKQLITDELLLEQVFSVLVTAHYQTSPSDLQLLLNNKAVSIFVLINTSNNLTTQSNSQAHVLGVVMLIREGQIASDLVAQIKNNSRRMRDQFIPQSLLIHCGIKNSFEYSYQRVIRIAIHPQIQRQGLGGYFLNEIEKQLQQQGIDFLGASFAGNANLLKFWQQSGFSLARIGFNKDKASGEHSCLMLKAIDKNVLTQQHEISQRFYQQFCYWLTDEFNDLPAFMVWQVLHHNNFIQSDNNTVDFKKAEQYAFSDLVNESISDFINGQRQYSSCVYGLHQWLLQHCLVDFNAEVLPLIARILQKQSIKQVCAQYGFTGNKMLNQHFIEYIAKDSFL